MHLFAADLVTDNVRDLTPFRGVSAQGFFGDAGHPAEVLVEMNLRDRRVFGVHRCAEPFAKVPGATAEVR